MLIDARWNINNRACYPTSLLEELYDRPMSIKEVLTRKDGKWDKVSNADRIWVLTRPEVMSVKQRNEWLARILERLNLQDPRSLAIILALRSDTITYELVRADAYAHADAAYARADAAAAAARADDDAERQKQITDALEILAQ